MSRPLHWACVVVLAAAPPLTAEPTPIGTWILVTAPALEPEMQPLVRQRQAQGFHVEVIRTTDVLSPREIQAGEPSRLRGHLDALCRKAKPPVYLLLAGAVETRGLTNPPATLLPPLAGSIARMKGQPTDQGYGTDEVALGRFPARTPVEARFLVQKTLAFEAHREPGQWKRRVTLLVGHPGGATSFDRGLAESYIESACVSRAERLHPSWTAQAVVHCPRSRWAVPDAHLRDRSLACLKEGQLFTVYAGHSSPEGFWSDNVRFLDRSDWGGPAGGRGIFVSCGCFGCQLCGAEGEGYGLAALRNPVGPVAVVGSHGESYAAIGQLAFDGLVQGLEKPELPSRLGDLWRGIRASIARGKMDLLTFNLLDATDGSRGKVPLDVQRREHLEMWMLLGDPALLLPALPGDVRLTVDSEVSPGQTLVVRGELPSRLAGAKVRVTLERTAGSTAPDLEPLPDEPVGRARVALANHVRANRHVIVAGEAVEEAGRFAISLPLPARLPWKKINLRTYAWTTDAEGIGVATLTVKPERN